MAFLIGGNGGDFLNSGSFNAGMEMDAIFGGDGADFVLAWGNDDLLDGGAGGDFLSGGTGNDSLEGGEGNDDLWDGSGNDWVNGGTGNDVLHADLGNDIYVGGAGTDTIWFYYINRGALDNVEFNVDGIVFDLAKSTQNLGVYGVDQIFGFENVSGSEANDKLFGSSGVNVLTGFGGNDVLDGRAGNDHLIGGGNGDQLIGGKGADRIEASIGGGMDAARDRIDYNSVFDSGVTDLTRDVIFGFDKGGKATDDKIDLSTIDANPFAAGNQAFKFVSGAFGAQVGEVRCVSSGGDTIIFIDTDRDKGAEMTIKVDDVTGLKAFDFIL